MAVLQNEMNNMRREIRGTQLDDIKSQLGQLAGRVGSVFDHWFGPREDQCKRSLREMEDAIEKLWRLSGHDGLVWDDDD